jgi:hypothetical protein
VTDSSRKSKDRRGDRRTGHPYSPACDASLAHVSASPGVRRNDPLGSSCFLPRYTPLSAHCIRPGCDALVHRTARTPSQTQAVIPIRTDHTFCGEIRGRGEAAKHTAWCAADATYHFVLLLLHFYLNTLPSHIARSQQGPPKVPADRPFTESQLKRSRKTRPLFA